MAAMDVAIALKSSRFGQTVQVEVTGDRIILRGVVGSYYFKQMAQEVVKRALNDSGATIQNDLEVVIRQR